jgi:hypothetical protein
MIMVSKTLLFALLFVTSLNLAKLPAQDSGCTQRTIAVGVVDGAWNFVPNLSAADFRGQFRGHDVQILSASVDTSPRHIVVLLDASGSMTDPTYGGGWKIEKTVSEYLVRFAPPQTSIAFMGFSRTVLDTERFAEDAPELLKNLSALVKVCEQPRKGLHLTALYDAISSARSTLGVGKIGDVICALTDGEDNKSQTTTRAVEEELLSGRIRLFGVVMLHPLRSARAPEGIGPEKLYSMAEATGGNGLNLPYTASEPPFKYMDATSSTDAVNFALQRLFLQMGEFYRVEMRLPETVEKPTKWKLEAVNTDGKPMRGVEVHYPQELMPCAKASP